MTFKEAHTKWSSLQENQILAGKTRNAVYKVLMEKCGDMDVVLIDKNFVTLLMKDCKESQQFRVNAASILCHVLNWLHKESPSEYPAPDFTYSISNVGYSHADTDIDNGGVKKKVVVKTASEPKKNIVVTTAITDNKTVNKKGRDMKKEEENTEKKAYQRRAVVQIDPTTLKEVARFDTAAAAEKVLSVKNVIRAITRNGLAGKYYWAFADEFTEDWQPVKSNIRIFGRVAAPKKSTLSLADISDDDLYAEIKRRGNWHGDIVIEKKITL